MAEPSNHVLVGNLPADLDDAGLKTNFEAYGNIKWSRLFDSKDGKKYAIIEFQSQEEATWLVENLDGNIPLGLETEVARRPKPAAHAVGCPSLMCGPTASAGHAAACVMGHRMQEGGTWLHVSRQCRYVSRRIVRARPSARRGIYHLECEEPAHEERASGRPLSACLPYRIRLVRSRLF